jgi:hypothetical protein
MFLVERGEEIPAEAPGRGESILDQVAERTGGRVPAIMVQLYRAAAVDRDERLHELLDQHGDELVGERSWRVLQPEKAQILDPALRFALCVPLNRLIDLGAIELRPTGSGSDGDLGVGQFWLRIPLMISSTDLSVRLTPLGRWAMNAVLRAEGAHAPSTDEPRTGEASGDGSSTEAERVRVLDVGAADGVRVSGSPGR